MVYDLIDSEYMFIAAWLQCIYPWKEFQSTTRCTVSSGVQLCTREFSGVYHDPPNCRYHRCSLSKSQSDTVFYKTADMLQHATMQHAVEQKLLRGSESCDSVHLVPCWLPEYGSRWGPEAWTLACNSLSRQHVCSRHAKLARGYRTAREMSSW